MVYNNAGGGALDGSGKPALATHDLTKTYSSRFGSSVTALRDVSVEIPRGSVTGVLGPNGAGKTTLIKCFLDLVVPDQGRVVVGGTEVSDAGPEVYRQVSALLEGARNVYWRLSVQENVEYFTGLQQTDPATVERENAELLDALGLTEKKDATVNTLSRGMKQKTALACTLARRTPIVFLDEPTLGLDVEASMRLLDQLQTLTESDDRTVVLTTHDMETVQRLCDHVVILDSGTVVADDSVENLLDPLRTQAYELVLEPDLGPDVRATLEREFTAVTWTERADGLEVVVTLDGPDRIYDLVGLLGDEGATIRSLMSVEPDVTDVFLDFVGTDDATVDARAGGQP